MSRSTSLRVAILTLVSVLSLALTQTAPSYSPDPLWPTLPNNWVLGTPSSIAVDTHDNVWLVHRPRLVAVEKKDHAAPAVVELDAQGRFLQAWGGPGEGYEWPETEHTIYVDDKDQVWICGSGAQDDVVLKFTNTGKFLMQIGKEGQTKGNADTANLNQPADLFVYKDEVFVADGYGNRRVIVFNAGTGAYKRQFGAFGNTPEGDRLPPPPGAAAGRGGTRGRGAATIDASILQTPQFELVHSTAVSNDGLVYVADRTNRRVQIFSVDGTYLKQLGVHAEGPAATSAAALALSADAAQSRLYVADNGELKVLIYDRKTLTPLGEFGGRGSHPGEFTGLHDVAVDSKGVVYTAEVTGQRFQRLAPAK